MAKCQLHLFWAKLGKNTWPNEYHPAVCHLIDVGNVARQLWDNAIRPKVKRWVCTRLGLSDECSAGSWLAFWVAAHDIGKLSPGFQARDNTDKLKQLLVNAGFDFPCGGSPLHGDISTRVLAEVLADNSRGWSAVAGNVAENIAIAVGGHHGVFPCGWDEIHAPLGNCQWAAARRELLGELARLFGVPGQTSPQPPSADNQAIWMFVAGLASVSDWIGSCQACFKPAGSPSLVESEFAIDRYFHESRALATKAVDNLHWPSDLNAHDRPTFSGLFPLLPQMRPLQTAVVEAVDAMTRPGLLIVEAPTGEGKTEAAWYAAASWRWQGGQGTYVALPTMATSNQMFDRIVKFLASEPGASNLMLLHGKALLNEQFNALMQPSQIYSGDEPSGVVAEPWFATNRKHGLLAPFGVGTIDQVLLAVLQTRHVFVRLYGLAGKCVILDEVHAYDTYMNTLIENLLRWLAALGCPVVLLSATLPREKRRGLIEAYAGSAPPPAHDVAYPRLSQVDIGGDLKERHFPADPSRARTVQLTPVDEQEIADKLRQSLAGGGCAAVIRNTVGQAQRTYIELCAALKNDGIDVQLFHARFMFGDRQRIENCVIRRYGLTNDDQRAAGQITTAPHRPAKAVLVASPVIEQSLDLDFDLIFTDVASPLDIVIQRAGRLHRHERSQRPAGVAEKKLYLINPEQKNNFPDFGDSRFIYAPFILYRSYAALKSLTELRLPDDVERLIEQVYGTEPLAIPEAWQAAVDASERNMREQEDCQQLNALCAALARPNQPLADYESLQSDADDPTLAPAIQARTRDSDPTIQAIIIYQIDGKDFLDAAASEPFDEFTRPDLARVRRLLDNEVTIGRRGFKHVLAQVVPTGWRATSVLRYHRIIRVDQHGNSVCADLPLSVDGCLGVRYNPSV